MTNTSPIRSRVRRLSLPDATYFITTNVQHRKPIFARDDNIELLRRTLREAQKHHPFAMLAYAFMPDHLHLMIQLRSETDISRLLQSVKRNFTRNYQAARGIDRALRIWQRSFFDHVIRDEHDYWNHLHYIHYNPVKHGYVARPEDYPHTSYLVYVQPGWYEIGWGHREAGGWSELYDE